MKIYTYIHFLLVIFLLQSCSKTYTTTIKINGKVSADKYTKIEALISALHNMEKYKFKEYKIERSDVVLSKTYQVNDKLIYTKETIFTEGEYQTFDSAELNNQIKGVLNNLYSSYDKIFISSDDIKISDSINHYIKTNKPKDKKKYQFLVFFNVAEVMLPPIKVAPCPSTVTVIPYEYETMEYKEGCINQFGDQRLFGYYFKWTANPSRIENLYKFSIYKDSSNQLVFSDSCPSKMFYLINDTNGYFLTMSKIGDVIQKLVNNKVFDDPKAAFYWKIESLCDNGQYSPPSNLSKPFYFSLCPSIDKAENCK